MAKAKLKFEPNVLPRSISEITRSYIQEFVAYGVKAKEITPEKLDSWIKTVENIEQDDEKTTMKKYASIRSAFVEAFIPSLNAKSSKTMSDFFKTLKA